MTDQGSVRSGAGGADRQAGPYPGRDRDEEKRGFDMEIWWEERSLPAKILLGIGFAIAGLALLALLGWVVMLLWNWLMPEIFGLPSVSYWQAWGLARVVLDPVQELELQGQRPRQRPAAPEAPAALHAGRAVGRRR